MAEEIKQLVNQNFTGADMTNNNQFTLINNNSSTTAVVREVFVTGDDIGVHDDMDKYHSFYYKEFLTNPPSANLEPCNRQIMSHGHPFITRNESIKGKVIIFANLPRIIFTYDLHEGLLMHARKLLSNGTKALKLLRPHPDTPAGAKLHLDTDPMFPTKMNGKKFKQKDIIKPSTGIPL